MAKSTTANSVIAAAKTRPVFYTRDTAKVKVALWKNTRSTKDNAPIITGMIGGSQVAGFLRQGPSSKFIQFVGKKLDNGFYEDKGTARVVAGSQGYPKLIIKLASGDVWADTSKEGTKEFLASMGLNIEAMDAKQEAMAQIRQERQAARQAAQA